MEKKTKAKDQSVDKQDAIVDSNVVSTKKCFIITPIGSPDSIVRKKAEGVIRAVIKPVLNDLNYSCIVPQEMSNPGSITNAVIEHIINDELVIANLTDLNPNVMYELAVRHASRRPVVCIVENNTKLPFDINQDRVIIYEDNMVSVEPLKENLKNSINSAIEDENNIDNPIYRAFMGKTIIENLSTKQTPEAEAMKLILERLDRIENRFSAEYNNKLPNLNFLISDQSNSASFYNYKILFTFNNPQNVEINEVINFIYGYFKDKMSLGSVFVDSFESNELTIKIINTNIERRMLSEYLRFLLSKLESTFELTDCHYKYRQDKLAV